MTGGGRTLGMPKWYLPLIIGCVLLLLSSMLLSYDLRLWFYTPIVVAVSFAVPLLAGWLKAWGRRFAVIVLLIMFAATYVLLVVRDRDAKDNFADRRVLCAAAGNLGEYQCNRLRLPCGACR